MLLVLRVVFNYLITCQVAVDPSCQAVIAARLLSMRRCRSTFLTWVVSLKDLSLDGLLEVCLWLLMQLLLLWLLLLLLRRVVLRNTVVRVIVIL